MSSPRGAGVADLQLGDVELEVRRHFHRQRLDVDLARHLRQDAAFLHPGRLAGEVIGHGGVDRLVEPDFLQVDVGDVAADLSCWYSLSTEEWRLAAVDHDVEHGIQATAGRQRAAQVALGDRDRDRILAAVENARDQTLPAQAPRLGRAEDGTVLDHQFDALASHGRAIVATLQSHGGRSDAGQSGGTIAGCSVGKAAVAGATSRPPPARHAPDWYSDGSAGCRARM